MNEVDNHVNFDEPIIQDKMPKFLRVLGILTLVNTGLAILGGIFSIAAGKPSEKEILASKVEIAKSIVEMKKANLEYFVDLLQKIEGISDAMYANFLMFNVLAVVIAGIGVTSAVMMFKRMKLGFHCYIIYSFLSILSVYAFVAPSNVPTILIVMNTILAGLFVFMYSRNLKWLTK
jgi:hypothetical protein